MDTLAGAIASVLPLLLFLIFHLFLFSSLFRVLAHVAVIFMHGCHLIRFTRFAGTVLANIL